jgi:NAD(P)-dependent dehydrogenase (short-subunit alcohol dehydrogenase family)
MSAVARDGELAGRVAFISGGSSGIGREIALHFAREGAAVTVADLREEPREGGTPTVAAIEKAGGAAKFFEVDVSNVDQVETAVTRTVAEMGGLDIMVCAAGVLKPLGSSLDVDPAALERHFAVNVFGTFFCNRAALRVFVPARTGKIVNVASNMGLVGVPGLATYAAGKAAVIGLTKSLAVEFGEHGINVNALCPGATATALNAGIRQDEEMMERWRVMTPLRMGDGGRFIAEPSDIAEAAVYLASERSRFATGSCLVVDGGWIAH